MLNDYSESPFNNGRFFILLQVMILVFVPGASYLTPIFEDDSYCNFYHNTIQEFKQANANDMCISSLFDYHYQNNSNEYQFKVCQHDMPYISAEFDISLINKYNEKPNKFSLSSINM